MINVFNVQGNSKFMWQVKNEKQGKLKKEGHADRTCSTRS